eukprot:9214303-Pyramimonas_sp.AAC.1
MSRLIGPKRAKEMWTLRWRQLSGRCGHIRRVGKLRGVSRPLAAPAGRQVGSPPTGCRPLSNHTRAPSEGVECRAEGFRGIGQSKRQECSWNQDVRFGTRGESDLELKAKQSRPCKVRA